MKKTNKNGAVIGAVIAAVAGGIVGGATNLPFLGKIAVACVIGVIVGVMGRLIWGLKWRCLN